VRVRLAAECAAVAGEIARLIGLLDDHSIEIAEDSKARLISIGGEVVQPLSGAVRSLDRYGQLSAIEVFEHLRDSTAGPALMDLSATSTRRFGSGRRGRSLSSAFRKRCRCCRPRIGGSASAVTGPGWIAAVAIRHAPTALGAWAGGRAAVDGVVTNASRKHPAGLAVCQASGGRQRSGRSRSGGAVLPAVGDHDILHVAGGSESAQHCP
jgi:hypothetical protein